MNAGTTDPINFNPYKGRYPKELLRILYARMLKPRMFEEKMLILLRQGKIGKWFSGIGQEAISVGTATALVNDEYILTMHRNLGVFTTREVPLDRLISQFQGKKSGFTQGRDRSFHFGTKEFHIVGMISHLGPQMAVADGIALAQTLRKTEKVTLVFTGEGATSEGDFHEALNVAAVWNLPVIFIIENNGYGLSTPVREQYKAIALRDRGVGYGMEACQVDGNNILEVFDTVHRWAEDIRQRPRPVLIECLTFRMRGHEEASGTKYVPEELLNEWASRDPLKSFGKYLLENAYISHGEIEDLREKYKNEIEEAVAHSAADPFPEATPENELNDVYAPRVQEHAVHENPAENMGSTDIRYLDAIHQALEEALAFDPELVLMGQDIAEYGGAFKVTDRLVDRFGKTRVMNTPLCESAIVGVGLGLAILNIKSVIEMQFADFVTMAFNQIVNNLAKAHYRWGQTVPLVIRMPTGAGTAAGPFHSQSNEAWFTKVPGLKVVYPAFPDDAKGLLCAAIDDPNPVLFFEHKLLYRSVTGKVPSRTYRTPIGVGRMIAQGEDMSVVTYGLGVHWALEILGKHPEIKADLIDLRSLQPWDRPMVTASVKKTGKILILHEDTITCGFGAEIAACVALDCFHHLDAPIMRCASLDTPVPANKILEEQFLASSRLEETLVSLFSY